jgi:hypothetical protein
MGHYKDRRYRGILMIGIIGLLGTYPTVSARAAEGGVEQRAQPLVAPDALAPDAMTSASRLEAPARGLAGGAGRERKTAVFVYAARWTDNRWGDIVRLQTEFEDSYLGTVGMSRILHRFSEDLLLEAEVNLTRHWGEQDHLEVNAAANLRWSRFPWDRWVDTSFAYGLGPSYAFAYPVLEELPGRPASRGLVFMVTELTFAPPRDRGASWEGLLRIHHRSGAFDLVSEASGSNFIATGIRFRY